MTARASQPAMASTSERILDVAERLGQTRGFNGFSYADIAQEIGVTKASLHYHFATKAALGVALVHRYAERFQAGLDAIAASDDPVNARLRRYAGLYEQVLVLDRLCLCGMFAAEMLTLPAPVQSEVRAFFEVSERWLETILRDGVHAGQVSLQRDALDEARYILGALEGAMLLAHSFGDATRFAAVSERLISEFEAPVRAR